MAWLQIKVDTDPENTEHIESIFLELGALSITLEDNADQPLYEPELGTTPLWQKTRITALFDAETNLETTLTRFTSKVNISPPPDLKSEILEDKDWEREWIKNYKPMQFGHRLWVCPSWIAPPDPDAITLLLDPGLAFGTGTHPTTALCLEWLDSQELNDKLVIDYGCGSGILGIAALLLGAKTVHGIDNDPQALTASRDNCSRNGIPSKDFEVLHPRNIPVLQADVLIANILSVPLIELATAITALIQPGGKLALSGILESQANDVMAAYEAWFTLEPVTIKDGWVRIDGTKK